MLADVRDQRWDFGGPGEVGGETGRFDAIAGQLFDEGVQTLLAACHQGDAEAFAAEPAGDGDAEAGWEAGDALAPGLNQPACVIPSTMTGHYVPPDTYLRGSTGKPATDIPMQSARLRSGVSRVGMRGPVPSSVPPAVSPRSATVPPGSAAAGAPPVSSGGSPRRRIRWSAGPPRR